MSVCECRRSCEFLFAVHLSTSACERYALYPPSHGAFLPHRAPQEPRPLKCGDTKEVVGVGDGVEVWRTMLSRHAMSSCEPPNNDYRLIISRSPACTPSHDSWRGSINTIAVKRLLPTGDRKNNIVCVSLPHDACRFFASCQPASRSRLRFPDMRPCAHEYQLKEFGRPLVDCTRARVACVRGTPIRL